VDEPTKLKGLRQAKVLSRRQAGVLLHITSLPGPSMVGELGPDAFRFVDFLASAGFFVWQLLPVNPTQSDGSPYQCSSVHAGNPRLISLDMLLEKGWLKELPLDEEIISDEGKSFAISQGWEGFKERATDEDRNDFDRFCAEQGFWLEDYALFQSLRLEQGGAWWEWIEELRDRDPQALALARARVADQIAAIRFEQYIFFRQWMNLKAYANERNILLFGDVPIFVAQDSAEVWSHRSMFDLQDSGLPRVVAGVPPDYFSATGQRWGNPLYRWEQMEQDGFSFWLERMKTQSKLFDVVRIDHFRGFAAYWEIPASEKTAMNGSWVKAPGKELFARLYEVFPDLVMVAEDLGVITPDVDKLRRSYGLPGMKILQFAFSGDPENPYLPYNHTPDSVVYTGTHDNDTTLGWYLSLDVATRNRVDEFLGYSRESMPWPLIRAAFASRANLAVVPMQDILNQGGDHRMNTPGTDQGNWSWRFDWEELPADLSTRVRSMLNLYGR
jgi:4-alpha-glucanotransferase